MDFLTFKSFISVEVLILFYYIGALILPVSIWLLMRWVIRKYHFLNNTYESGKEVLWKSLTIKQQAKLTAIFITCFLFMELFWRMLFEFLIAYMQIRDALIYQ